MALDEQSHQRLRAYQRLRDADCAGEIAFVQACLQHVRSRRSDPIHMPANLSFPAVFEILRLNKVANLVAGLLLAASNGSNPAEFDRSLDSYRRKTAALNALGMQASLSVQDALARRGIPFVFMKGPLQQKVLYGNFFAKPAGDVDVLVAPPDFIGAREALRTIGYEVTRQSRSLWWSEFLGEQHLANGAATVDLHHRIQQPGSPSPRSTQGFLQRRQPVELMGRQVPLVSGLDMLLVSCISIAKSYFNREPCAGYACDVHASVMRLNDEEKQRVVEIAEDLGLSGTLLLGLRSAEVLFGRAGCALPQPPKSILKGVADDDLRDMIIAPWTTTLEWPQRRRVLWELCGRAPVRYATEAGWAAAAELSRRVFERGPIRETS